MTIVLNICTSYIVHVITTFYKEQKPHAKYLCIYIYKHVSYTYMNAHDDV